MKLKFWGAAGTVTGSMHELNVGGQRFILDCGLYQGRRQESRERNLNFPWPAESVDQVVLSHAHIDHSGNLPGLVRQGFSGPIHATPATADLCEAMLKDSAFLQEKDAAFLNKRAARRRKLLPNNGDGEIEPLYTIEDAEKVVPLFQQTGYHAPKPLSDSATVEFFDAGHILGSACMVLTLREGSRTVRLGFSGDVGRRGLPILRDPENLPPVDYLILESTYGGRVHQPLDAVSTKLADVVNRTCQRGGKLIVPAFAVGRTQQLVLLLHDLWLAERIPKIPIFVDSPLAVDVTAVYRRHTECYDREAREFLEREEDPFGFRSLRYIRDVNDSKALNDLRGPYLIISASGMCEGGRILHHLRNNIEDPRNTVLITGFQAANTLGRKIVERHAEVPIFGELMRLRSEVVLLNELSAHADQPGLLCWVKPLVKSLKKIYLVHGEAAQAAALQTALTELLEVDTAIASRGDEVELT